MGSGLMHAKVYAGLRAGMVTRLLLGSGNLSDQALGDSVEAMVEVDDPPAQREFLEFLAKARAFPPQTLESIQRLVLDPQPEGLGDSVPRLQIGHVRDTFPLSRVILNPVDFDIPTGK